MNPLDAFRSRRSRPIVKGFQPWIVVLGNEDAGDLIAADLVAQQLQEPVQVIGQLDHTPQIEHAHQTTTAGRMTGGWVGRIVSSRPGSGRVASSRSSRTLARLV
jgi:hypothetical protein